MKQSITMINGVDWKSLSSSGDVPEFLALMVLWRKEFKSFLYELNAITDKSYTFCKNHFEISGFFYIGAQCFYYNTGDLRGSCQNMGMLLRTAKDHKDFTGGSNNFVSFETVSGFIGGVKHIIEKYK